MAIDKACGCCAVDLGLSFPAADLLRRAGACVLLIDIRVVQKLVASMMIGIMRMKRVMMMMVVVVAATRDRAGPPVSHVQVFVASSAAVSLSFLEESITKDQRTQSNIRVSCLFKVILAI